MKRIAALLGAVLTACNSTTGVVSTGGDTYMVAGETRSTSPHEVTAQLYREAIAYCAERKKEFKTVGLADKPGNFARLASSKLDFTCVEKK
jgi:hypothetical protein